MNWNGQGQILPVFISQLNSGSSCFLIPLEFTSTRSFHRGEEEGWREDTSMEDNHLEEMAHLASEEAFTDQDDRVEMAHLQYRKG